MNNYFRITGYCKEKDFCFIVDSYGYFEKLWQLSSDFVQKGMEIIAVGASDKFLDGNLEPMDTERIVCLPVLLAMVDRKKQRLPLTALHIKP